MRKVILSALVLLVGLTPLAPARAADTVETFDIGATDLEFYAGYSGIGLGKYQGEVSAELMLGLGLIEGFSGYIGFAGGANERFCEGGGSVSIGLFGTPLDTDHLDLDLMLNGGYGSDGFGVTVGFELNFDLTPDLGSWGLYLRMEEGLAGRDDSDPIAGSTKFTLAPVTALTLGTYYTIMEGHQILAEFDMSLANNPAKGEDALDIGGVAIGYNVALHPSIEFISQIYLDIPFKKSEDFSAGVMLGVIVAMPSPAAAK